MLVREIHTIVVGSGAAGLNTADRLWQYGVRDLALVTEGMNCGTSRNTGSDKQTYYKLSLAGGQGDSVRRLARVLYDGGCVDGVHALCEASLSCQGFFKLVELGVPFPHDKYGEYVGYKTDHDPNHRGTSVGPYTSRYMTEALEKAVREKQIAIYDKHQVIKILTSQEKVYAVLCLDTENGEYVLMRCTNLVWATGGPAGMYAGSVYPASQFGASGLAFEAGVLGKNLTEWQYGMASVNPRWNVSGSYMQVLPRIVSTDADGGDEREFLMEFYQSREEMMDMTFLKGYQWPFDSRKAAGGSSMIDLLVYRETCVRGRRVWLDYRRNPGNRDVDFAKLSEEARGYLESSGCIQQTPFERLMHMNGPAAAFYREHGVDLETERLEIAVCAQHNNGGLSVDGWWQTNVEGFFAAGEAAGTHGIYRPGGSALNSGQVGSTRAAEYIAAHRGEVRVWDEETEKLLLKQVNQWIAEGQKAAVKAESCWQEEGAQEHSGAAAPYGFAEKWKRAAGQMSRVAAMLRDSQGMEEMLTEITSELETMSGCGDGESSSEARAASPARFSTKEAQALSSFYRYRDMRICQKVYLTAMLDYQKQGGKSRGSAIYSEPEREDNITIPELISFSLDGAGREHQELIQEIRYDAADGSCKTFWRQRQRLEDIMENRGFEVIWREYRERKIYE